MKKYVSPTCKSHLVDCFSFLCVSGQPEPRKTGLSEKSASPLKRLLPFIVNYNDLEPDIKRKLKKKNKALNYRTLNLMGIDYLFVVCTYKGDDDICICFYCQGLKKIGFIMYYNLYDILEPLLLQIRHKNKGVYDYKISVEVLQKLPTLCKLIANEEKNSKSPTFGLPMITFLDEERKFPLLSACFKINPKIDDDYFENIHSSMFKIIDQLVKEVEEAGLLNQTIKTLIRNGLRLALYSRHLVSIP